MTLIQNISELDLVQIPTSAVKEISIHRREELYKTTKAAWVGGPEPRCAGVQARVVFFFSFPHTAGILDMRCSDGGGHTAIGR